MLVSANVPNNRDKFMRDLNELSFDKLYDKYLTPFVGKIMAKNYKKLKKRLYYI